MARLGAAALRAYAVSRSLFRPRELEAAIRALGFVQIDPIRAPARAQDLVLRHRVANYRSGDLDRSGRRFGYDALPLLWRDTVIGWANVSSLGGKLDVELGFAGKRPRDGVFRRELDAELARFAAFLDVDGA